MKIFIRSLIAITLFASVILLLFYFDVMWKSPSHYKVNDYQPLTVPIMDMEEYNDIRTHRRPYIYSVTSKTGGKVYILGLEHRKDPSHPQFDSLRTVWNNANPDVALVEGRLGFFFSWAMNAIEEYGESGLTAKLSKEKDIPLYTWEPSRQDEIDLLLNEFSPEHVAMFYTLRPYFSNMRHGKPSNPEEVLQEYLESRTDYDNIRNVIGSLAELDSIWQADYPEIDWKSYSDEKGWPEGYLYEIWNASNLARDRHLVQSILDLIEKGNTVFVTMGSSHAPRIEQSLKSEIN